MTGSALEILGKVLLTLRPSVKVRPFQATFYVTKNFSLPVDGLLGLNTMKEMQMVINPEANVVVYQGKNLQGMKSYASIGKSRAGTGRGLRLTHIGLFLGRYG